MESRPLEKIINDFPPDMQMQVKELVGWLKENQVASTPQEHNSELTLAIQDLTLAQFRTGEKINILADSVQKLEIAQSRTEQKVQELTDAQSRTEQKMQELADAQSRTEQKVQILSEAQSRTEQKVQELADAQSRTEQKI